MCCTGRFYGSCGCVCVLCEWTETFITTHDSRLIRSQHEPRKHAENLRNHNASRSRRGNRNSHNRVWTFVKQQKHSEFWDCESSQHRRVLGQWLHERNFNDWVGHAVAWGVNKCYCLPSKLGERGFEVKSDCSELGSNRFFELYRIGLEHGEPDNSRGVSRDCCAHSFSFAEHNRDYRLQLRHCHNWDSIAL